jgi:putative membrane protein
VAAVTLRLALALGLLGLGVIFLGGWWRLTRRATPGPAPARAAAGTAAVVTLAVALCSPLDDLAHGLLVAHMVQHLLLMMVAAPLLLLADPFPLVLWGLPRPLRRWLGRHLTAASLLGRAGARLTAMPAAWAIAVVTLAVWHLPGPHQGALGDGALHAAQHASFFASALLFWWPVLSPAPRWRPAPGDGARIIYLVTATFPNAALGLLLMLSPGVLYPAYAAGAPRWGPGPLEDQAWAGFAMWAGAGTVEMLVALGLVWRFLAAHEPTIGVVSLTALGPRARMKRFGA